MTFTKHARIGYDKDTELTFIRPAVAMNDTTARCLTCGRVELCICDGCTTCTGPKRTPNSPTPDADMLEAGLRRLWEELETKHSSSTGKGLERLMEEL